MHASNSSNFSGIAWRLFGERCSKVDYSEIAKSSKLVYFVLIFIEISDEMKFQIAILIYALSLALPLPAVAQLGRASDLG
jgi:hypothetical protein